MSCIPLVNVGDFVYLLLDASDCESGDIEDFETIRSDEGKEVYLHAFKVCGIATLADKWYVTDFDSEWLELDKEVFTTKEKALQKLEGLR